jgi:hypothetical protein
MANDLDGHHRRAFDRGDDRQSAARSSGSRNCVIERPFEIAVSIAASARRARSGVGAYVNPAMQR